LLTECCPRDVCIAAVPGAPATAPVISQIGVTSLLLTWVAPLNTGGSAITGYKITRSVNGAATFTIWVPNTATNATLRLMTGLAPATTYAFKVRRIVGFAFLVQLSFLASPRCLLATPPLPRLVPRAPRRLQPPRLPVRWLPGAYQFSVDPPCAFRFS
jgi:hypothetical protein